MEVLVYISVAVAYLNALIVTGIIAGATRNWHPLEKIVKKVRKHVI